MVTEVLQKDLCFIIDPEYQNYCMKMKLIECVPIPEHGIYLCNVICVERLKIVESTFRIVEGTVFIIIYYLLETKICYHLTITRLRFRRMSITL